MNWTQNPSLFERKFGVIMLAVSILLVNENSALAQTKTTTLKCSFSDGVSTDFDTGKPRTKASQMPDLIFDQVQSNSDRARLIGNAGATDVVVVRGVETTNFIETTTSGNLNTTAVYRLEKSGSSAGVPVVHSRHFAFDGLMPSQFWGVCRALTN